MIISETKEFVFLHNPKCGGTTVRAALLPFDTTGNFFWMFAEAQNCKIDKAHMPLHVMRRIYPDYFALLKTYFVFMLVRNPYRRAISSFNETRADLLKAMRQADNESAELPLAADATLKAEKMRAVYKDALNGFIGSMRAHHLNGWNFEFRHWVRQRDIAYLGSKRMADVVMKLEDWPECLDKLAVFNPTIQAALKNAREQNVKSLPFNPMESLTAESIRKINQLYREDFLIFQYPMA